MSIRVGLIGTGGIARGAHIPGFLKLGDRVEVRWLCDVSEDARRQASELVPGARQTGDYRELLADGELDAVVITTPNRYHLEPAVAALEAGKHVLCEKPLAMNAVEAKQIVAAERASGKILQVGLQQRFSSEGQFLKQFIDGGGMGEIYYARAQALRRRGVPAWGVFIDKEQQGGGPLIDIGVHILDFTLWLMGYPKPVSASGATWNRLGTNPTLWNAWGEYDREKFTVEDLAVGFIRLENGAVVTLESSFMANIEGSPFGTQLMGTRAGAECYFYENARLKIFREENRQLFDLTPKNLPRVESAHAAEIAAFVEAVETGAPSPVPGIDGWALNAIFDALYLSAETGREEPIDLTL